MSPRCRPSCPGGLRRCRCSCRLASESSRRCGLRLCRHWPGFGHGWLGCGDLGDRVSLSDEHYLGPWLDLERLAPGGGRSGPSLVPLPARPSVSPPAPPRLSLPPASRPFRRRPLLPALPVRLALPCPPPLLFVGGSSLSRLCGVAPRWGALRLLRLLPPVRVPLLAWRRVLADRLPLRVLTAGPCPPASASACLAASLWMWACRNARLFTIALM